LAFVGAAQVSAKASSPEAEYQHLLTRASLIIGDTRGEKDGRYFTLRGTLKNGNDKPVKFVQVKATLLDKAGAVVDTNTTYAVTSTPLLPGESKSFDLMLPANKRAIDYQMEVLDGFRME
jgi:hypothetical protein